MILIEMVMKSQHLVQIAPPLFEVAVRKGKGGATELLTCSMFGFRRNPSYRYRKPIRVRREQKLLVAASFYPLADQDEIHEPVILGCALFDDHDRNPLLPCKPHQYRSLQGTSGECPA